MQRLEREHRLLEILNPPFKAALLSATVTTGIFCPIIHSQHSASDLTTQSNVSFSKNASLKPFEN